MAVPLLARNFMSSSLSRVPCAMMACTGNKGHGHTGPANQACSGEHTNMIIHLVHVRMGEVEIEALMTSYPNMTCPWPTARCGC